MNVLLLTPEACGGTLFMRLLTMQMQLHNFDKPIVSGHIDEGLETIFSDTFNQELVIKRINASQTIQETTELLKIANQQQYTVGKLCRHNMLRHTGGNDGHKDLLPFYRYVDENFFVIASRRKNIFEHSLSWALNNITNKLNVFDSADKLSSFFYYYKDGVTLDPLVLKHTLQNYKKYVEWSELYFNIGSYYVYEDRLQDIESYIMSLPMFATQSKKTSWKETFGISFNDWNKYHYYKSDVGTLFLENNNNIKNLNVSKTHTALPVMKTKQQIDAEFTEKYNLVAGKDWPAINRVDDFQSLPEYILDECKNVFGLDYFSELAEITKNAESQTYTSGLIRPSVKSGTDLLEKMCEDQYKDFLDENRPYYNNASDAMHKMQELGIMPTGIPIKKQTLAEKKYMIKNFDECLEFYNAWAEKNPEIASPYNDEQLQKESEREQGFWRGDSVKRISN